MHPPRIAADQKLSGFEEKGKMQIANQSIPSNRCQLPSDRANQSIVIGGIEQQENIKYYEEYWDVI